MVPTNVIPLQSRKGADMNHDNDESHPAIDDELVDRNEMMPDPARTPDCPSTTDLVNHSMKMALPPVAERVAAHLATGCVHCTSKFDAMAFYLGHVTVTLQPVPEELKAMFRKPNPIVPPVPESRKELPLPSNATVPEEAVAGG